MSFDSLTLRILTSEFRDAILGGRIRHVAQENPHEIILKISTEKDNYNLLISAHPTHARAHLIKLMPKTKKRFHFADFLMQHLMRWKITRIEQITMDRILQIHFSPIKGILDSAPKLLIAEFMGKHSNIILVDESTGKILESIKHIDEEMSRYREVLPGIKYVLPPQQEKLNPFNLEKPTFMSLFEDTKQQTWRVLLNNIDGMSPMLAKEIVARAERDNSQDALWDAFQEVFDVFQDNKHSPQVHVSAEDDTDVIDAAALPLVQFPEAKRLRFDNMNAALEYYYEFITLKEEMVTQRNAMNQVLNKRRAALENKLMALLADSENAENADDFRISGELLLANLHKTQRGQTVLEVENYYDPEQSKFAIELDPRFTPSENAQRYFKQYKKAKRGMNIIRNLISENEALLDIIKYYVAEVEHAESLERLLAIRAELVEKGWISDTGKKAKKQKEGVFRRYISSNDYHIYVGRNSKENDLLITRIARKDDMWMHAKHIAGSHVIIRNPEKRTGIPMPTLLEAAKIAAHFSKASKSSNVPVDYTWAKFVIKPKGSKPGFVTYTREKTLYVEPEKPGRRT